MVTLPAGLAVDVGGTKLAAGVVDRSGAVLSSGRVPTPAGSGEEVFSALAALVERVVAEAGVDLAGCGVGCGGPMAPGGEEVSPINIAGWRRFPLRGRLAALTGLETVVDNDAKCLARAEGWTGSARGERDFLAMVVSTGVGGGIFLDGRILAGASGNAGHIGHVIVEPGGRVCGCGARGCLEAEASGTAIAAATGRPPAEASAEVVARTGRLVGRGIASVANLLDLRLAVVGGSVALGFGPAFLAAAREEVDRSCRLDHSRGTRVELSRLGGDGGLVGAAALLFGEPAPPGPASPGHPAPPGGPATPAVR